MITPVRCDIRLSQLMHHVLLHDKGDYNMVLVCLYLLPRKRTVILAC